MHLTDERLSTESIDGLWGKPETVSNSAEKAVTKKERYMCPCICTYET